MNLHFFELIFYVLVNDDQICQRAFEADVLRFSARMDICLFRRWWSGPLRLTTHKHIIHSQHDTHWEVILPWHAGNQCHITSWPAYPASGKKTDFSSLLVPWLLFTIFPLCPPVCCWGENVGLNRYLIYLFFFFLIMSSLSKKRGANVPMNPMQWCPRELLWLRFVKKQKNKNKNKKLEGMPQWNISFSEELQDR